MRGLDRNELRAMLWTNEDARPFPHYLNRACDRLIKRGILVEYPCDHGHIHLLNGPEYDMALRCHRLATSTLEVT